MFDQSGTSNGTASSASCCERKEVTQRHGSAYFLLATASPPARASSRQIVAGWTSKSRAAGWVFHPPPNLSVKRLDLFLKKSKMTKRMPDEESLMVTQSVPGDRSSELRDLLTRAFFLARSAICSADKLPSRSAASINQPDTQKTSDSTSPSLTFASSSTF